MLSEHIIPAVAGLLYTTAGALMGPNDTPAPWEISSLSTFSPSGRPGSSPYSILNITIADPNTIIAGPSPTGPATFPPSTAICNTSFAATAPPYNQILNCTEVQYGSWTFMMLEAKNTSYASATTNFDVRFTHVDNVTVLGDVYSKVYVGTGHFEVGKNMAGICGGSGVCSWSLKEEERPYLVHQTQVSCTGTCS